MFVLLWRFPCCLCLQQKAGCEIRFSTWKKRSLRMQGVLWLYVSRYRCGLPVLGGAQQQHH